MANKKDLRGSIEKMREVAQLLGEWADDMEASLAKKSRKGSDAAADIAAVAAEPVVSETPAAHPEAVPPEPAAPPRQPVAADVRALLAEKCAAGFRAQVQALINSYGAAKFSEVDPAHYADLVAAASLLGGDSDAG